MQIHTRAGGPQVLVPQQRTERHRQRVAAQRPRMRLAPTTAHECTIQLDRVRALVVQIDAVVRIGIAAEGKPQARTVFDRFAPQAIPLQARTGPLALQQRAIRHVGVFRAQTQVGAEAGLREGGQGKKAQQAGQDRTFHARNSARSSSKALALA